MGRRRHKTHFHYRCLITIGCAFLLFSIANVYRDSVDAVELTKSESTMSSAPSRISVPSPNAPATTSASPAPTPSNEVKRPNPLRRFFSWAGREFNRLFRRSEPFICYLPPTVSISSSTSLITFCPTTATPSVLSCSPNRDVSLSATAGDPDEVELLYTWGVTGGRLRGEGRNVTWDLSGLPEGTYTATVEVNDGNQLTSASSIRVSVALCPGCEAPVPQCPVVSVSCPSDADVKQSISFQANVSGGDPEMKPTYTWSVNAGRIISGQGTPMITVDPSNLDKQAITATVTLGAVHPACTRTVASCTIVDY